MLGWSHRNIFHTFGLQVIVSSHYLELPVAKLEMVQPDNFYGVSTTKNLLVDLSFSSRSKNTVCCNDTKQKKYKVMRTVYLKPLRNLGCTNSSLEIAKPLMDYCNHQNLLESCDLDQDKMYQYLCRLYKLHK